MHTLYHGDCLDIMPTLEAQSVDAVICDPPYGTTACKWDSVIPFAPMWEGIKRVLKPRGACVLFGSQPFTSALVMSNVGWFKYQWVWKKTRATDFVNCNNRPMRKHEDISVFSSGTTANGSSNRMTYNPQGLTIQPRKVVRKSRGFQGERPNQKNDYIIEHGNHPTTILEFNNVHVAIHPTQKPLVLLEYLVKTYTNEGDTVLDFAFGSGTTGAACGNLGRRFIGIEKDKAYFDLASDRIATAYAPLRVMQEAS